MAEIVQEVRLRVGSGRSRPVRQVASERPYLCPGWLALRLRLRLCHMHPVSGCVLFLVLQGMQQAHPRTVVVAERAGIGRDPRCREEGDGREQDGP
jgi:hypothetical protein